VGQFIEALHLNQDLAYISKYLDSLKRCSAGDAIRSAEVLIQNESLASVIQKRFQFNGVGGDQDPICCWLYDWYMTGIIQLQRFVLRFIPNLIGIYLYNHLKGLELSGILSVFHCIYTHEVVVRDGKEIIWTPPSSFRYQNSVPQAKETGRRKTIGNSVTSALTDSNLKKLDTQTIRADTRVLEDPLEVLMASKLKSTDLELIIRIVFEHYVAQLAHMPVSSIKSFCFLVEKLMNGGMPAGFTTPPYGIASGDKPGIISPNGDFEAEVKQKKNVAEKKELKGFGLDHLSELRYVLGGHTMQVIINGLTFALSKNQTKKRAKKALVAMHNRAENDLNAKILLSTNALFHLEKDGL